MAAAVTAIVEAMAAAWNAGDVKRVLALAEDASGDEAQGERFLVLLGVAQQQTGDYARAARTFGQLTCIRRLAGNSQVAAVSSPVTVSKPS